MKFVNFLANPFCARIRLFRFGALLGENLRWLDRKKIRKIEFFENNIF